MAKVERRNNILNRYAQMAAPGGAPAMGGGMDMGADANAFAGPGLSAMTTDPMAAPAGDDMGADLDAVTEPGDKKPWGSVCPVCGSDDVNISDSNADCQSCGAAYKILQSLELISNGKEEGAEPAGEEEAAAAPEAGAMPPMPPAGAPVGGPMGAPAPGAPAPAGMPAMAEARGLFRLAASVDSDVYLKTAMPSFDRTAELRLPVGMVCPKCGNREANKVKDTTFCHDCGNIAKTTVAQNHKNPSKLDVTITWID
jgi:ssDNA-binding Zn-finger/Zn-ribbon topoisomerase 1